MKFLYFIPRRRAQQALNVGSSDMCPMSYILVLSILGLSSYAVGTLPDTVDTDYAAEDGNVVVHLNTKDCGNGRLDPGEECDCGPGAHQCREDPCCHPNCQLKLHSQCSDNDPCCEKCKFKAEGVICHKVTDECGIPEYCSGDKGECPASLYKRNGANCTGEFGSGICIHGVCKSYNQPCHEVWRSSETEPSKEMTKCSAGMICVNQTCVPIRDLVNGNGCARGGSQGEECSGHGECTASYHCHCIPGWKGHDCFTKADASSSKNLDKRPGIVKGVGPEQRDSTSNTTALVGGLVTFVIIVSVIFVVMAFRYLPARAPKDETPIYPPVQVTTTDCEADGPRTTTQNATS